MPLVGAYFFVIPGWSAGPGPEPMNTGDSQVGRGLCSWVPGSRAAPEPRNDGYFRFSDSLESGHDERRGRVPNAKFAPLRIAIIGFFIFAGFFIIPALGITLGIIFIVIARRQNLQQIETRAILLGCFDRPHEGVDHPRDRLRLARRYLAPGECGSDRVHRQRNVVGRRPATLPRAGGLDRRQTEFDGTLAARRQHAFHAQPHRGRSPPSAISTALRVNASDSPASSAAAASVALLREPRRRPPGLPDRPFSNGRPRSRPGGFGKIRSLIAISVIPPSAHSRRRDRQN